MDSLHAFAEAAVVDAVKEELAFLPESTQTAFYQWLLELRCSTRLYYVGYDMARQELWPRLRNSDVLLDMVIRASMGFRLRMGDEWDRYLHLMSLAITELTGLKPDNRTSTPTVTDELFNEKLGTAPNLRLLLANESWVVLALTVERCASKILPAKLLTGAPKAPAARAST